MHQRRCVFEDCYNRAIFAFNINQAPIYCIEHRESDTLAVCFMYCKYLNCKKRVYYEENMKNKSNILCEKHKEIQKVKVVEIIPTDRTRCKHASWCRRIAKYAHDKNMIALWCEDHKKPDDVYVHKLKCKNKFCNQEATHSYDGKKLSYCFKHFNKKEKFDNKIKKVLQKEENYAIPSSVILKEIFYV